MTLPAHVFRAYDIRGIVGAELDASFAFDLGRALGQEVRHRGGSSATLAFDCRESSEGLMRHVAHGLVHEGISVMSQGMGPTPLLYFAMVHNVEKNSEDLQGRDERSRNKRSRNECGDGGVAPNVGGRAGVDGDSQHEAGAHKRRGYDLGVMVTGSHNPPNYNGFKIVYAQGAAYGEEIQALCQSMRALRASDAWVSASDAAPAPLETCVRDAYVNAILTSVRPAARRLRLSVDAANGAAGPLVARVLRAMGHEVIGHGLEPDGTFPLHHPDPTAPASLAYMRQAVLQDQAEACLGLDGDGDRLAVVDELGEAIVGDRLLICFAEELLKTQPGATIIGEVKCSRVLFERIEALGGRAVMGKVGHSVMKAQIRAHQAALAGEVSGHFFFADRWFGFDDGVYSSARFAEWLAEQEQPLSVVMARLPQSFATPEIRVPCSESEKFVRMRQITKTLGAMTRIIEVDGVRAEWPDGWGLVRASNTEPVYVLRAEAESVNRMEEILALLHTLVAKPIDDA